MKTALLVSVLLLVASFAFAQTTVEVEVDPATHLNDDVQVTVCKSLDAKLGAFLFVQAYPEWSQFYAGPTYSPADWCQVGLGAGMESEGSAGRLGGWVWAGKGKLSATWAFEESQSRGSGAWHKSFIQYQATERVSLGLIDRSFYGTGALVEYTLDSATKVRGAFYEGGASTLSYVKCF